MAYFITNVYRMKREITTFSKKIHSENPIRLRGRGRESTDADIRRSPLRMQRVTALLPENLPIRQTMNQSVSVKGLFFLWFHLRCPSFQP